MIEVIPTEWSTDRDRFLAVGGGLEVVVLRAGNGYVAFEKLCVHRDAKLFYEAELTDQDSMVRCNTHGCKYDLTTGARAGYCTPGRRGEMLQVYRVRVEDGRFFLEEAGRPQVTVGVRSSLG